MRLFSGGVKGMHEFVCIWIAPALKFRLCSFCQHRLLRIGARLLGSQLRFGIFYYVSSDKTSCTRKIIGVAVQST